MCFASAGFETVEGCFLQSLGSKLVYSNMGQKTQEERVLDMDSSYTSENVSVCVVVNS